MRVRRSIGLGLLAAGAVFAPVWYVRLPFVLGLTVLSALFWAFADDLYGGPK